GEAAIEGSTEPMRRDLHHDGDVRYKLGFVIQHNPGNVSGGGSCIFAHLWQQPGETTAGCTAMDEPAMQALLAWLDPANKPVFGLRRRAEHQRLAAAGALPRPLHWAPAATPSRFRGTLRRVDHNTSGPTSPHPARARTLSTPDRRAS